MNDTLKVGDKYLMEIEVALINDCVWFKYGNAYQFYVYPHQLNNLNLQKITNEETKIMSEGKVTCSCELAKAAETTELKLEMGKKYDIPQDKIKIIYNPCVYLCDKNKYGFNKAWHYYFMDRNGDIRTFSDDELAGIKKHHNGETKIMETKISSLCKEHPGKICECLKLNFSSELKLEVGKRYYADNSLLFIIIANLSDFGIETSFPFVGYHYDKIYHFDINGNGFPSEYRVHGAGSTLNLIKEHREPYKLSWDDVIYICETHKFKPLLVSSMRDNAVICGCAKRIPVKVTVEEQNAN